MLPALQPSRPKPPQQRPQPTYTHVQTRTSHATPQPQTYPPPKFHHPLENLVPAKPRSQVEAMPPFTTSPFSPPRAFYDSAVRHPVFFTESLRKPPFPIPNMASQGWNPVASGYIVETRKAETGAGPRTKL